MDGCIPRAGMSLWLWPLLLGLVAVVTGIPYPYPYPYAMPYPMPYPMPRAMPYAMPMPQPIPQPRPDGGKAEGGKGGGGQPFQKDPKAPVVYAPYPGEIVLKLIQNWDSDLLDMTSPEFQILEGNLRSAIQAVMGPMTQVTNVYFRKETSRDNRRSNTRSMYNREGYVPGNPPSRPKTVAHMMVNGGSDAASVLERAVTPDGSLGDGLKVYKDSFNAY